MAYIGNSPGVASQRVVTTFTATSGQTTFTPSSGYTLGYCDVFFNGVKLVNGDDYTASNGTSVVLASAAAAGDSVEIVAHFPRGLSDGYLKSEADALFAQRGNNLSDLSSASTARTNLGLGNVENKSSATIRGELTSGNVTGALGYTPVNKAGDTVTGRLVVKDDLNADKSYPFAVQNQSQQPWYLRAETTSNRFALHLNAFGNVIEADASGRVTMPRQSAFFASGVSGSYGVGATLTWSLDTSYVSSARNSGFNNSTGRYTAPVTGLYFFQCDIYVQPPIPSNSGFTWQKNGAQLNQGDAAYATFDPSGTADKFYSGQLLIELAAGDTFGIQVRAGYSGYTVYGGHSRFSGYLVG